MVNTCGFIDRAKEESVEAILNRSTQEARRSTESSWRRMVQKYGWSSPEFRGDSFLGLDELELVPMRRSAFLAAASQTAPCDAPLRRSVAPRPLPPPRLRLPQGRGGVRQPLHVLHDPADARPPAQPDNRLARGRSEVARGPGSLRARPDLTGHNPLRRRPGIEEKRAGAPGREAPRGDGVSLDPLPLRVSQNPR